MIVLAAVAGVWLLIGLILLIVCLRDGGGDQWGFREIIVVVLCGPPVMALLLIQGLVQRHPS